MRQRGSHPRGQALVELALVLPLFVLVLAGIIIIGLGIFYQAQLTNAAREAARFAAVHSASAQCPTVSKLDPNIPPPLSYYECDRPEDGWPRMTAHARDLIFGVDPGSVHIAACWSGYVERDGAGGPDYDRYDASPPGEYEVGGTPVTADTVWAQCTIDGTDPTSDIDPIRCDSTLPSTTVDRASAISEDPGRIVGNRVTAYACYIWQPPLAGFVLIPSQVTLRAVITEPIQRQQ